MSSTIDIVLLALDITSTRVYPSGCRSKLSRRSLLPCSSNPPSGRSQCEVRGYFLNTAVRERPSRRTIRYFPGPTPNSVHTLDLLPILAAHLPLRSIQSNSHLVGSFLCLFIDRWQPGGRPSTPTFPQSAQCTTFTAIP